MEENVIVSAVGVAHVVTAVERDQFAFDVRQEVLAVEEQALVVSE